MNKKIIVLSGLFFSFSVGMISSAHAAVEHPLGMVVAVEREMDTRLDECAAKFEKVESKGEQGNTYLKVQCEVDIFPKNDLEEEVSSSLYEVPDMDLRTVLVNIKGTNINVYLNSEQNGYSVSTSTWNMEYLPELKDVTKEDFLKAAKKLLDRFPKLTVKVYKVVQ